VTTQTASFVLYSDENWLVVDKPHGIPTHGGDAGDTGAQEWLSLHFSFKTFVCSRLDKGTSGILLFAKTPAASAAAERIHTEESALKTYYFLSDKDARHKHGEHWVCSQPLDGKNARSEIFFDRQIGPGVFRYRAQISRGRMHQIRRHAAMSGCPLLGDGQYGGSASQRIALHCAELRWPEIDGVIRSPLPATFSEETHRHGAIFFECMAAAERRGDWMSSVSNCWRAVQRGEISAFDVSVDVYAAHALVWVYDETDFIDLQKKLEPFLLHLQNKFSVRGTVYRRIAKNPHKKGLIQEILTHGVAPEQQFVVWEHDWRAQVTLTMRQHVGLFLDHRDNRRRVQLQARGKRVANLFSYTCAFGIAAAAAGCEVVMNVDASAGTLNIGKQNFALNELSEARSGKFIEKDVRLWLERQIRRRAEGDDAGWDIIVCDPPTFSSTQDGGVFHVGHEWMELAASCARILKRDGVCYFSTNCQANEKSSFEKALQSVFATVQRLRAPMDFPEVAGRAHAHFFECRDPLA
jgi:23S rRNA (cytosine1962-C5)-methyltransferase